MRSSWVLSLVKQGGISRNRTQSLISLDIVRLSMSSELITALAIDMTARNVQDAVKKKGLPWSTAKGFDTFSPVG